MPRHTARIEAPAADVYARIADPRLRTEWLPELEATSGVPDRPLQDGDSFAGYPALLGHRLVGHSDVVHVDHGALRIEEQVTVGARFRTAWTVSDAEGGAACIVTQDIDFDFPQGAFGRLERWVLGRYADRMQRAGLARLAASATSGSPPPRRPRRWPRRRR